MFREALKQKAVGWMLVGGALLLVCGLGGTWVFSMAGVFHGTFTREAGTNRIRDAGTMNWVPLTILMMAVGVILCLAGFGYAWYNIATERSGVQKTVDNVKVLARYAANRAGDMLTEYYQIEEARGTVRFYVRLMLPTRETLEFECSESVFNSCGEGMFGRVVLQNKWLGQFIGYVGSPVQPNDPGI